LAFAVGVCNKPEPVASVRGAKGCRWKTIPFRIEPARGKVRKNPVPSSRKESWNVLNDDVAGS
jgi:hypothetical protein